MDRTRDPRSEKNDYMRLALEKLLSSSLLNYMRDDELKKLRNAFLLPDPSDRSHIFFFELAAQEPGRARSTIANLSFSWQVTKEKELAEDGSLWSTCSFLSSVTVREMYSLQGPTLVDWLSCIRALHELTSEIASLNIPNDIREMTHSSEERAALEREELKTKVRHDLSSFFSTLGKNFVHNLRVDGKGRAVPLSQISYLLPQGLVGRHEFKLNGARAFYSWRAKHYELELLGDADHAIVRRIA